MITDRAAPDTEWIPTVSAEGWVIITRDTRIQHNLAELEAVREASARMIAMSGDDAGTVWEQLEVLLANWRRLERLLDEPGPYVYRATRSGLSAVALQ